MEAQLHSSLARFRSCCPINLRLGIEFCNNQASSSAAQPCAMRVAKKASFYSRSVTLGQCAAQPHTQLPSAGMKPNECFPGRRNRSARLHAAIASAGLQVVSMPLAPGTLEETGTLGVVKGFRTPGRHEGERASAGP
jgi:hypothetical protein